MKSLLKIGEMIDHCPVWLKDAIHHAAKDSNQKTDDMELHRRSHSEKAKVNQLDVKSRKALKYVSYRTQDRDDEIVIPKGIDLNQFRKYMHVLVNHNYSLLPVGSDEMIDADDFGIKAMTSYADTGEGTLANVVWHLVSQGHLKASSIGFVPLEYTKPGAMSWDHVANTLQSEWKEFDKDKATKSITRIITKGILLEHSDVSVPCNADAEMIQVIKGVVANKGLDDKVIQQLGWKIKEEDGILTVKSFHELLDEKGEYEIFPAMKPFPNEHAARQNDPDKYKRFVRKKNEGGEGVDFIFGVMEDGKTELQSVRFDKGKFTPEQVKQWLKEHKLKEEVEEAKEEKGVEIKSSKKQECEELSESLGKKLVSLIKREADVDDLVKEKEKLDSGLDKADEALLSGYEALSEKIKDRLAKLQEKSVKLIRPPEYIKVLYKPLKEAELVGMVSKAVEHALNRKTGKLV